MGPGFVPWSGTDALRALRVALLQPDLQPYRIPLLSRLAESGDIELTLVVASRSGPVPRVYGDIELDGRVEVVSTWSLSLPGRRPRLLLQGGLRRLLFGSFDVVVAMDTVHNLTIWALWLATFLRGPRLVLFGYGLRPENLGGRASTALRSALQRALLRRASAVAVYTHSGRAPVVAMGVEPEDVFVVGNTLDTEYLRGLEPLAPHEVVARTAPLRPQLPLLLFVGRMQAFKRADALVDAVSELERLGRPVDLVLIGDGPERARLEARAAGQEGVTFIDPEYDPRALGPFFAAADLLVIPGRIGLTCVHGFAYGLPSVTGSPRVVEQSPEFEYVEDGVNGVVLPDIDPSSLAAVLSSLLDDPESMESMSSGARTTARRLSMDQMAGQLMKAVDRAVDRGVRSR